MASARSELARCAHAEEAGARHRRGTRAGIGRGGGGHRRTSSESAGAPTDLGNGSSDRRTAAHYQRWFRRRVARPQGRRVDGPCGPGTPVQVIWTRELRRHPSRRRRQRVGREPSIGVVCSPLERRCLRQAFATGDGLHVAFHACPGRSIPSSRAVGARERTVVGLVCPPRRTQRRPCSARRRACAAGRRACAAGRRARASRRRAWFAQRRACAAG